ncbi:hypothetical protein [Ornithinibacillus sp. JPR2-1]|uniref:hypothetical protein n=2 Tax=unclassified Ornithinibacillus TaxID=2620869 RepID=UPI0031CFDB6B
MLVIGYVYEDKYGMFHMTNQLIGADLNKLDSIELLDFYTNTPDDFYSFLEYYNVTDYIFVCDGKRMHRFVGFLNNNYPIRFQLVDTNQILKIGHSTLSSYNLRKKFPNNTALHVKFEQETSPIKDALYLLLTGQYPLNTKGNQIKHFYVENKDLLNKINSSVLKNCVINSIIFYDRCTTDILPELFPVLVNFHREKETIESMKLIHMNEEEIIEGMKSFQSNGEVLNNQITNGIIDYSAVMNIDRNQRLFYFKDGIFRDYSKNYLITNNFDEDFYVLVNYLSYKNTRMTTPIMRIFPMVINISALLGKKKMYMVTPYNAFFTKEYLQKHKDFKLIGFVIDDQYYLYNISLNKNYKVNKATLLLLEYYLKNKIDSIELQKYIPNKLESFKEQFYKIIESIS